MTWSKQPPSAEEVRARMDAWGQSWAPYMARVSAAQPRVFTHHLIESDGEVFQLYGNLHLPFGVEWYAVPTPAEVAARDTEIARLADLVERFQLASGLCVPPEEKGGDPGGVEPEHVSAYIVEIERECDALRASLAAEKARGEAMGAAMATIRGDAESRNYDRAGLLRATDPHAFDSAAAVIQAARAIAAEVDEEGRYEGHPRGPFNALRDAVRALDGAA